MNANVHSDPDLLPATTFLNQQLLILHGVEVELQYQKIPESDEDDEDTPYFSYTLQSKADGRIIEVHGLDSVWKRPSTDPTKVDWKNLQLRIYPCENFEFGLNRYVYIDLYGLEKLECLKKETPRLRARLFGGYQDRGFFAKDAPVILEFRRRLRIENAEDRIEAARKAIAKLKAMQPYMTDAIE